MSFQRYLLLISFLSVLLLAYACGGSGNGNVQQIANTPTVQKSGETGFSVELMEESFLSPADKATLSFDLEQEGDLTTVNVRALNASKLRAAYFNVYYDADSYVPVNGESTPVFGDKDDLLTATFMSQKGYVQHGQVLIDPLEQDGFNGSDVIARISFEKGSFDTSRHASLVPSTSTSTAVLFVDEEAQTLNWHYASTGDYDQNKETNVADLTPMASRMQLSGPFDYAGVDDVVDGDNNNQINISDITPIGVNFKNTVFLYSVYKSDSTADYPESPTAESVIDPYATVLYELATGARNTDRLLFTMNLPAEDPDAFYWVRPSDRLLEGTPSLMLAYGNAGIVDPIAVLTADPETGEIPLEVSFDATGSTAPTSDLGDFEWDFDGDGVFGETDNGEDLSQGSGTAIFTYDEVGTFDAAVRVSNTHGITNDASVAIIATPIPNNAPNAVISADVLGGTIPLDVNFDASASTDPDVGDSIVLYEWDFEGDGTFDMDTGSVPTVSYTYSSLGNFDPVVRVTDTFGVTDTASLTESGGTVIDLNAPPVADIQADTLTGDLPLLVNFDASGSSDFDGTVDMYEWDLDGDGTFESNTGSTPTNSFTYTTDGTYDPAVRVTDNDGGTDTASISETGGGTISTNAVPVAAITGNPLSGNLPLDVDFDASGSTDSDGTIVLYEWDFDGDGSYDSNTGSVATTSFTFTTAGDFDTTVRVTDNEGATDTASMSESGSGTITVNDPPVAAIAGTPLSGSLPLLVDFDASAQY